MECPKCNFQQPDRQIECLQCGIIFEKYLRRQTNNSESKSRPTVPQTASLKRGEFLGELLFHVKPDTNPLLWGGRALFFLIMLIWGVRFILASMESNYVFDSFWHLVNLPFHEVGHIIFRPFGRLMTSLGGSIMQVLMPLICLVVFLVKTRDAFAAAFALWWTGENFMDLAPYINDARSLTLPLLGGNTGRTAPYGFHDWEFILRETGLIRYDHVLAKLADTLGKMLMLCALVWGGYILFKQYKNIQKRILA